VSCLCTTIVNNKRMLIVAQLNLVWLGENVDYVFNLICTETREKR